VTIDIYDVEGGLIQLSWLDATDPDPGETALLTIRGGKDHDLDIFGLRNLELACRAAIDALSRVPGAP
jgi:hypothetical protein